MFLSCLQGLINFLDLPFRVLHPLTPVYFLHLSTTVFLHKPFLSGEWQCLQCTLQAFQFCLHLRNLLLPSVLICCQPFFQMCLKHFPSPSLPIYMVSPSCAFPLPSWVTQESFTIHCQFVFHLYSFHLTLPRMQAP